MSDRGLKRHQQTQSSVTVSNCIRLSITAAQAEAMQAPRCDWREDGIANRTRTGPGQCYRNSDGWRCRLQRNLKTCLEDLRC